MTSRKKIKLMANERALALPFRKTPKGLLYAITNHGRIISYQKEFDDGNFLKTSRVSGYPSVAIRVKGENQTFLVHRLVAKYFLHQPDKQHKYVIHLNNEKEDNHYKNLKWVTYEKQLKHVLENRRQNRIGNFKLTAEKVAVIKKRLASGKTRLKTLANQFKVTDMQIHRIKTGENWGHVKI